MVTQTVTMARIMYTRSMKPYLPRHASSGVLALATAARGGSGARAPAPILHARPIHQHAAFTETADVGCAQTCQEKEGRPWCRAANGTSRSTVSSYSHKINLVRPERREDKVHLDEDGSKGKDAPQHDDDRGLHEPFFLWDRSWNWAHTARDFGRPQDAAAHDGADKRKRKDDKRPDCQEDQLCAGKGGSHSESERRGRQC